ncbi:MAG: hypothetical protein COU25_00735 [Candidatus Levybacteria bacterium CG10_big_fil_rev_8_21_14_0_10_35_13]|nr:MAG: hypothetical protein COU25_00735 [Candidatus Levybacteria bacterium CG10_big_fil_rev_8_21_14_0_10_35_13]
MFTLTNASSETKTILKWGGIILGAAVVIFIIFRVVLFLGQAIFPPPPPKPTLGFEKLTYPKFPRSVTGKTFTYYINTVTGDLPQLPAVAKINRIEFPKPDLLSLKNAGDRVAKVGFTKGPVKISNTLYEWTNDTENSTNTLKKKIRVNILNFNFNVTSDPFSNPDVVAGKNLPTKEGAISSAENFLKSSGYLKNSDRENEEEKEGDIDLTKTQTKIYSLQNGGFIEASSISSAQVIQVIFSQKDIDDIPIVYKKPGQSNIDVLIVGGSFQGQVLAANYTLHAVSDASSTYPILTSQQAFEELKKGNAFIASYNGNQTNISIKKVYLAYFFSDQAQEYTMPVIVFEGDEGFFAYVRAVTDEWVNK